MRGQLGRIARICRSHIIAWINQMRTCDPLPQAEDGCGRSKLTDSLTEQGSETMADCRNWPAPHAENWAKLGKLEKALWRVADWPVVGAATKKLEKRGAVWDHGTPEVAHFVHQPRHGFVDPA